MSTTATDEPRRRAAAPWIAVGLTFVALLAGAAVIGPPPTVAATGAAAWFPAASHRSRLAAGESWSASEWSRPTPFSLAQTSPSEFWVWAEVTEVAWDTADYRRAISHLLDPTAASLGRSESVWVLDESGARLSLELAGGGESLIFEPGRLDLPATLRPGDTWTSEGELARRLPGADWTVHSYTASYTAAEPTDPALVGRGCVVVAREFGFAGQTRPAEQTWCPGEGVVAAGDGDTRWAPAGQAPTPTPGAATPFDWGRADALDFIGRPLNQQGTGVTHVSPVVAPGIAPDGSIVFTSQLVADVTALDPSEDPAPVVWHGRPGGTPTTGGTFGGITVVTTSDRTIVAYGPDGQWLWQAGISDITRVPPVLVGDTTLIVVTLDGRVAALNLTTGAELWHVDLAGEIRSTPAVVGDRVIVGDQTGALTCLDANGDELWVIDAGVALRLAVSTGPDPVVVVGRDDSRVLQAYRTSDGSRVWRTRHYEDIRDIVALDGSFVLRDADRSTAIDPATGSPLWSWSQARTWAAVGGGDRLLLLTDADLVLVDGDGRTVRRWPHGLGDVSQSDSYLAAADQTVVAYGPLGMSVGRLP